MQEVSSLAEELLPSQEGLLHGVVCNHFFHTVLKHYHLHNWSSLSLYTLIINVSGYFTFNDVGAIRNIWCNLFTSEISKVVQYLAFDPVDHVTFVRWL